MLINVMDLYIKDYIYFQHDVFDIVCSRVWRTREVSTFETSRAPSFCRAEGAFLSVESPQVCLCYIFTAKRSIFIYKDYELFKY